MHKRKNDKSIFLLGAIILIVLASLAVAWVQLRTDPFSEQLKKGSVMAFLFVFSGDRDYRFFEVFLYHPQTRKGAITFIPGNVGSIIESLEARGPHRRAVRPLRPRTRCGPGSRE